MALDGFSKKATPRMLGVSRISTTRQPGLWLRVISQATHAVALTPEAAPVTADDERLESAPCRSWSLIVALPSWCLVCGFSVLSSWLILVVLRWFCGGSNQGSPWFSLLASPKWYVCTMKGWLCFEPRVFQAESVPTSSERYVARFKKQ